MLFFVFGACRYKAGLDLTLRKEAKIILETKTSNGFELFLPDDN